MTNNPYDPNANAYGGGSPYGQNPNPGGGPQPQQPTAPSGPAFVDPYQPRDRQPTYPPAVRRAELVAQGARSGSNILTPPAGLGQTAVSPTGGVKGAVVCLVTVALLTLGHAALLALLVAGLVYAASKDSFVKAWAANAFNLLLPYLILAFVFSVLGDLGQTVGSWVRYLFAAAFGIGALLAGQGRFFRYPLRIPALRA